MARGHEMQLDGFVLNGNGWRSKVVESKYDLQEVLKKAIDNAKCLPQKNLKGKIINFVAELLVVLS